MLVKLLTIIDKASMVLSLIMLAGGKDFLLLSLIAYPTSLLFLLIYWKKTIWTVFQERLFWIYTLYIIASFTWSANFSSSLYMTLKLIGTFLIGISFAVRYDLQEQLDILAWTFGTSAFLSLVWGLFLPQYGIMAEGNLQGSWSGIFGHKNILGRTMVLSTMVFWLKTIDTTQHRWLMRFCLSLSAILIVLSSSKTSLVTLLILLVLFPLYRALRWSYSWLIPSAIVITLTVGISTLFLVSQIENIVTVLGKDLTLTGRVPLWELVLKKIAEHPWLGYGYGGFWLGWKGESGDIYRFTKENWEAPNAHNGFLDVLLAFGIIGLIIATLTFLAVLLRSISCIRSNNLSSSFWPLWYLSLLLLISITESNMDAFRIYWALNIAVAISTNRKVINQNYLISKYNKKTKSKLTIN